MISLLVVNDPHVADNPPLGRTQDYGEDILDKLEEIGIQAGELEVDYVILTGDIFHVKRAPYVSHRLVQRIMDIFRSYPCEVLTVLGNHDLSEEGVLSASRQPVGVLARAGVITVLGSAPGIPHSGAVTFLGGQREVAVVARHYTSEGDADLAYYALTGDEREVIESHCSPVTIMVAHGSIVPPKFTRPYPVAQANLIDLTGIDLLLCGHIHLDLGIHEVGDTYFANVGSIARISRTKDEYTREIKTLLVTVHDDHSIEFQEVPVESARPAADVFLMAVDGEDDPDGLLAGEFATQILEAMSVEEMSIAELIATYAADVPDAIKKRLEHYLVEAGL